MSHPQHDRADDARTLALVAGLRTPFSKAGSELAGAETADLGAHVFREVLDRSGFDAGAIDEVILGAAGPSAKEANVARVAALRAGVPQRVPAMTVMRNCASGMEAIATARTRLRAGEGDVFLVGGAESMSNFPLVMGDKLTRMFQRLGKARSLGARVAAALSFRPSFLAPRVAIVEGLTDPTTGLMMGHTAENVARAFGVSRADQDAFALRSHRRAARAAESGRFRREIAPMVAPPRYSKPVVEDNGIRADQTIEALGRLRPVFDKREGDVTVGNACQITDGAVGILAMSLARARAEGLTPVAIVRDHVQVGLDPAHMGLGPAHAIPALLRRNDLTLRDIDLFEINEAFAAQVLGCQSAMASTEWCSEHLGASKAIGELHIEKLNVHGGAIALGHPIAATGARIAWTLALELRARGGGLGIATLCIGGGQGQALLLEALP